MQTAIEKPSLENPYIKKKLPSWDKIGFLLFLLLLPGLTLIYGTILLFIYKLLPAANDNTVFFIGSSDSSWYLVGIVLSIGTIGLYINSVYKIYLKAKFRTPLFLSEDYSKRRIEGYTIVKAFAFLSTAIALFFAAHIYDNKITVEKQSISINEFGSFGKKKYLLKEIATLQYVQVISKEGYQTDTNYRIKFKDSYTFDSRDNMLNDTRSLIHFLSVSNKLQVDTIKLK